MGTNYYWINETDHCVDCSRKNVEKIHVGKSSFGWCFSLHVTEDLRSLDDWKEKFKTGRLEDEYGDLITAEDMLKEITVRSNPEPVENRPFGSVAYYGYPNLEVFLQRNHAIIGPNNLLRHINDGVHCVGHGEGTWDLIEGYFS